MNPIQFDHLVLEVRDIDKSLAFYHTLLGCESERLEEFRQGHAPFVSVRVGQSLVDLFPSDHPTPGPQHFCIAFAEPISTVCDHLARHHVAFDPPARRFGALGMGDSIYVKDPDGHTVELRSYATSA